MLTQEELKKILYYRRHDGEFVWISGPNAGYRAGGKNSQGYTVIRIGCDKAAKNSGKLYRASHLAVLWMTGLLPLHEVDHINGVKTDDRWENLREATRLENQQNTKLLPTNTSGFKGVSWSTRYNNWNAVVIHNKIRYAAHFDTPEEADTWCRATRTRLAGEFANHG